MGRALASELDPLVVVERIVEAARELTGAPSAGLDVVDEYREGLERLLTAGGHGRLDVLGAPISIRGRVVGRLWVTEKAGGAAFDDDDRETVVVLAEWAGVAIDIDRLTRDGASRRTELARALQFSRSAMEIATAVGSDTDLPPILDLIAERGRALVEADSLLIWLREGDQMRIAAVAGHADVPDAATIPVDTSTAGAVLGAARAVRLEDVHGLQVDPSQYGMSRATSTLIVPLVHRGRGHGVLMAFDRIGATASFDADDQRTLEAFAASAATAIATARSVEAQRLHDTMAAAEDERRRWARELHDETLQGLASMKLSLAGALRVDPGRARLALEAAVAQLDDDIAGLRTIIADLRPAALDELGLAPALRTLAARVGLSANLDVRVKLDLGGVRLAPDIETVAYRVAQEALTNVVKHAGARAVTIDARLLSGGLRLTIVDDGRGVTDEPSHGYGIVGMRERAALAGGALTVAPIADGGTRVTLELPPGQAE